MSHRDHGRHHSRHEPHQRATTHGFPPISTERRSWTDNGVHYTMQTTGFSRPGISFGAMSGSASGFGDGFMNPAMRGPPLPFSVNHGLLGGAFGLLDGLMSSGPSIMRQQPHQMYAEAGSSSEDDDDDGDHRGFEGEGTDRPRSMFSRFKDKVLENTQRNRQASYSRDPSPTQRPQGSTRQGSYETEIREPSWTRRQSDPYGHVDHREEDLRPEKPRKSRNSSTKLDTAKALESAVDHHGKEIRKCKKQLEQASRHPRVSSDHL